MYHLLYVSDKNLLAKELLNSNHNKCNRSHSNRRTWNSWKGYLLPERHDCYRGRNVRIHAIVVPMYC